HHQGHQEHEETDILGALRALGGSFRFPFVGGARQTRLEHSQTRVLHEPCTPQRDLGCLHAIGSSEIRFPPDSEHRQACGLKRACYGYRQSDANDPEAAFASRYRFCVAKKAVTSLKNSLNAGVPPKST